VIQGTCQYHKRESQSEGPANSAQPLTTPNWEMLTWKSRCQRDGQQKEIEYPVRRRAFPSGLKGSFGHHNFLIRVRQGE